MTRFLRLFRQYRELEAMLAESQANYEKIAGAFGRCSALESEAASLRGSLAESNRNLLVLQDRLDALQSQNTQLWDKMQTAINNERFAYQSGLNVAHGLLGWGATYPGAHELPAARAPRERMTEPAGNRQVPSAAARQQAERNLREFFVQKSDPRFMPDSPEVAV